LFAHSVNKIAQPFLVVGFLRRPEGTLGARRAFRLARSTEAWPWEGLLNEHSLAAHAFVTRDCFRMLWKVPTTSPPAMRAHHMRASGSDDTIHLVRVRRISGEERTGRPEIDEPEEFSWVELYHATDIGDVAEPQRNCAFEETAQGAAAQ